MNENIGFRVLADMVVLDFTKNQYFLRGFEFVVFLAFWKLGNIDLIQHRKTCLDMSNLRF